MKILTLVVVATGAALIGGCSTAGYSASERNQMIARNCDYDSKQIVDDFDHDIAMLRPASHLTLWNALNSY